MDGRIGTLMKLRHVSTLILKKRKFVIENEQSIQEVNKKILGKNPSNSIAMKEGMDTVQSEDLTDIQQVQRDDSLESLNQRLFVNSVHELVLAVEVANALTSAFTNRRAHTRSGHANLVANNNLVQLIPESVAPIATCKLQSEATDFSRSLLSVGTSVISLVDEHSEPKLWILSAITAVNYFGSRLRYYVVDSDPDPNAQKKLYTLDAAKVMTLGSKNYKYIKNERVLALFNNTTVFYPARVNTAKRERGMIRVIFDDDDDIERLVDPTMCIPLPQQFYSQPKN